jgi:phosphatidylserine/phosphatidylglycerophosphate/cardiolipin synthase-like enzyme
MQFPHSTGYEGYGYPPPPVAAASAPAPYYSNSIGYDAPPVAYASAPCDQPSAHCYAPQQPYAPTPYALPHTRSGPVQQSHSAPSLPRSKSQPDPLSDKLGSALRDAAAFTRNTLSQRWAKAARLLSKEEAHDAPPDAWSEERMVQGTLFTPAEMEALWYNFRPRERFAPDDLYRSFPQSDATMLARLWNCVFQKDELDFREYVQALSNTLRRPPRSRLSTIFMCLTGRRDALLEKDFAVDVVLDHLIYTLRFLGYTDPKYGTKEDFVKCVWPDASKSSSPHPAAASESDASAMRGDDNEAPASSVFRGLSYGDFVMLRLPRGNDHFLYHFFGLFDYLRDVALGSCEGRPPQKEGFLRKNFSSKTRFKKHWCAVRDSCFFYYTADDKAFVAPARVMTLRKGCRIEPFSFNEAQGGSDYKTREKREKERDKEKKKASEVAKVADDSAATTTTARSSNDGDVAGASDGSEPSSRNGSMVYSNINGGQGGGGVVALPSSNPASTSTSTSSGNLLSVASVNSKELSSGELNAKELSAKELAAAADQQYGFTIVQDGYERHFLCADEEDAKQWMDILRRNTDPSFSSRAGVTVRYLVDGKAGFAEMKSALEWASSEIFISAWFMSAHIFLLPGQDESARLDLVLKARAAAGVRVYILLWNETKLTLDLNSGYTEMYLESLHENIKVIRHPVVTPMKWSHHQKILCVDQKVAFVGGLDVGFGRFDDPLHVCIDEDPDPKKRMWLGKNYYNPAFSPMCHVEKPFEDSVDRKNVCRMPWHDVHVVCDGGGARDVARSFIERWNHHKDALSKDDRYRYLIPASGALARRGTMQVKLLRSLSAWSAGLKVTEASIYAAYLQLIEQAKHFIYIENQFFISSTAGPEVQNLIAMALVDRIVKAANEGQTSFRVYMVVPVTPEVRKRKRWGKRGVWQRNNSLIFFVYFLFLGRC